jgi:hypothetical protein
MASRKSGTARVTPFSKKTKKNKKLCIPTSSETARHIRIHLQQTDRIRKIYIYLDFDHIWNKQTYPGSARRQAAFQKERKKNKK